MCGWKRYRRSNNPLFSSRLWRYCGLLEKREGLQMCVRTLKRRLRSLGLKTKDMAKVMDDSEITTVIREEMRDPGSLSEEKDVPLKGSQCFVVYRRYLLWLRSEKQIPSTYQTHGVQIVSNWILRPRPLQRPTQIKGDFRTFYHRPDSLYKKYSVYHRNIKL